MKILRNLFLALLCFVPATVLAQIVEPVKWSHKVSDKGNGLYTVQFKATIDEGWHLYDSRYLRPLSFKFDVKKFDVKNDITTSGELRTLSIPKEIPADEYAPSYGEFEKEAIFEQDFKASSKDGVVGVVIDYQACSDQCLQETCKMTISLADAVVNKEQPAEVVATSNEEQPAEAEISEESKTEKKSGSLWAAIIQAIIWGFIALLTPCVFPMIPMTVSFFMKNSGSAARGRMNASLYGLFIVALYTLPIAILIIITRVVGGEAVTADIFNVLATHWLPNLIFFVVFMIFAASFFGAFEITLPSKFVNKSDAQSEKGGLLGIFFMALTLVLVSFSCTGPIVGTVLIDATSNTSNIWSPILTMLAFSVAFALPFTLFAFFPSMLKKMPKSGGWLSTVKVVLGFIEIVLGFKFLSNADLRYHWGLLDREIYLAIWIVVFALLGLYLLGKIRFAHDSEVKHIGVGRLALIIASFSFVVYLIPGMWGAPLKALSGYLPPISTHDFRVQTIKPKYFEAKYSDILHLPHYEMVGFFEIKEAEAYAKKVNKPIFIDFTGHTCPNCRKMDENVLSDPKILNLLNKNYVIVSLYTDEPTIAMEEDWITVKGETLKEIGAINRHYQRTRFHGNAQPFYVLLGKDGKVLCEPRGFNTSVNGFEKFLKKGLEEFKKQNKKEEKKQK